MNPTYLISLIIIDFGPEGSAASVRCADLSWMGGTYTGWGVPTLARDYLPRLARRVPTQSLGVPALDGGYLPWLGGYLPWPGVPRVGTPRCGQTDACENSTFPILRMRAVNIYLRTIAEQ